MTPDPLVARQLTLGFSEREDRLLLVARDAEGATIAMMLTRRLISRLVNALASVLKRSSVAASRAPVDVRDDIVLMEHQGAIAPAISAQQTAQRTGAGSMAGSSRISFRLVSAIDIATHVTEFHLLLRAPRSTPVLVKLNRVALHRLLELLNRKADEAEWNIPLRESWLEPGQTKFVLN